MSQVPKTANVNRRDAGSATPSGTLRLGVVYQRESRTRSVVRAKLPVSAARPRRTLDSASLDGRGVLKRESASRWATANSPRLKRIHTSFAAVLNFCPSLVESKRARL